MLNLNRLKLNRWMLNLLVAMCLPVAALALGTVTAETAGTAAEEKTEWLFVQNAQSVTLQDGVLTLEGISPTTIFFSDRPERMAAQGLTSDFVTFWTTGGGSDSFKKDPPNATLSLVRENSMDDVVLTLANPRLDGDTLTYDVTVLEGREALKGGPAALFVDVIGMPLTPLSVAGVRRREIRRTVRRTAF